MSFKLTGNKQFVESENLPELLFENDILGNISNK
jgi:hypothetical protein